MIHKCKQKGCDGILLKVNLGRTDGIMRCNKCGEMSCLPQGKKPKK